jgi:hypothetical protein
MPLAPENPAHLGGKGVPASVEQSCQSRFVP